MVASRFYIYAQSVRRHSRVFHIFLSLSNDLILRKMFYIAKLMKRTKAAMSAIVILHQDCFLEGKLAPAID